MRLLGILVVVSFAVTSACQRSENRYLARNVAPDEVIGTWVMTPTGIDGLRFAGHTKHLNTSDHSIVLRPDGSCSYRGFRVPAETDDVDGEFIASACEWSMGDVGHLALTLRLRNPEAGILRFYFAEEGGNLLLWQYAGDPDAWKYVELMRHTDEQ